MKKWNILYENCKLPIRVAYFGFVLIAIGFLIQNESVNIFYTFENTYVIILSEALLRIGEAIIKNLPLFFMANLVAKRANSGVPLVMALVGYFTFLVFSMIFTDPNMASTAYTDVLGIHFDATYMPVNTTGIRYPLETGLLGSFLVALIIRYTYIRSRHRSSYSFLAFLNKDTAALIYTVIYCAILGVIVALAYPTCFGLVQQLIQFITRDLSDPTRIALYGFADRFMSILGLGNIIRYPFWFSSQGGSYMTLAGQVVMGDVNIWGYIQEASSSYAGAGRFITPYYAINMFVIPAIYLGMFFSISNKKEKKKRSIYYMAAILLSVIAGNPLPLELTLLFTAPLLLVFYLLLVALIFGVFSWRSVFLGFSYTGSTVTAMPGAFPDYIINIRNPLLFETIMKILVLGLIAGIIMFVITVIYYRFLAYDFTKAGKAKKLSNNLAEAVGGYQNIEQADASVDRLFVKLKDLEAVSYDALRDIGARRITETKTGLSIDLGSASIIIAKTIMKMKNALKRK